MIWRRLHAAAALIWVAAIVVQVILAGQAIADLGGSGDFSSHRDFGYTIGLVQLVVILLALVARMPRREIGIALGILGLYIVQTVLPSARGSSPFIAALHPLNAMILFTLSIWYARRAWRAAMEARSSAIVGPSAEPSTARVE